MAVGTMVIVREQIPEVPDMIFSTSVCIMNFLS